MSKVFIEEETLIGIGNAIREKNGTTDLIATTDMASAISNLPTGGGATYPDLWYNTGYGNSTRYFYSEFDVSNASKLIFDYEIRNSTTSSTSSYSKWVLTAGKGYKVGANSNTYSPGCELKAFDSNPIQETLFTKATTVSTTTIEIDVQDFSTLSLQVAVSPNVSGAQSYYGFLHLSNIHTE